MKENKIERDIKLVKTQNQRKEAPRLSLVRFGLGSLIIFGLLELLSVLLYFYGLKYLGLFPAACGIAILAIKFWESIELSEPEEKRLVGKRCLVIARISSEQRGVVRVYNDESYLDPETWSAESVCGEAIDEGKVAKVVGMRSIILEVEGDSSDGKSDSSGSINSSAASHFLNQTVSKCILDRSLRRSNS